MTSISDILNKVHNVYVVLQGRNLLTNVEISKREAIWLLHTRNIYNENAYMFTIVEDNMFISANV